MLPPLVPNVGATFFGSELGVTRRRRRRSAKRGTPFAFLQKAFIFDWGPFSLMRPTLSTLRISHRMTQTRGQYRHIRHAGYVEG